MPCFSFFDEKSKKQHVIFYVLDVRVSNKKTNNISCSYMYIYKYLYIYIYYVFLRLITYIYRLFDLENFFYTSRMDSPLYLPASLTIHMWAPDAVPKSTVGFGETPPKLRILQAHTHLQQLQLGIVFFLIKFRAAKVRRFRFYASCSCQSFDDRHAAIITPSSIFVV